jgi:hypothetical protein
MECHWSHVIIFAWHRLKKSIYPLALHTRTICAQLMNLYHRKSPTSAEVGILQVTKGYKSIAPRKKDASTETSPRLYIVLNESGYRLLGYIFSFLRQYALFFIFHNNINVFYRLEECTLQTMPDHWGVSKNVIGMFFSTENVQIFYC